MIQKTLLQGSKDYHESQIKIEQQVNNTLLDLANSSNGNVTRSVVIYELFMFSGDYEDRISKIEKRVNEEFDETAKEYNITHEDIDTLQLDISVDTILSDNAGSNPHLTKKRKVRFPQELYQQIDFERYWNRHISAYLETYLRSPFSDRLDRIACKEEIIRYINKDMRFGENDFDHSVAVDVCVRSTMDRYVQNITIREKINNLVEYREAASDLTRWNDRLSAMDTIRENSSLTVGTIIDTIAEEHDIDEEYTERRVRNWVVDNELYDDIYSVENFKYRMQNTDSIEQQSQYLQQFIEECMMDISEEYSSHDLIEYIHDIGITNTKSILEFNKKMKRFSKKGYFAVRIGPGKNYIRCVYPDSNDIKIQNDGKIKKY